MGQPGPWHERLPHFRMDFTPSSGEELQSEYFVPRRNAVAAIAAVERPARQRSRPHLQISEIRTIAADDLWMSPCYGQVQPGHPLHLAQDWPAVRKVLPKIERTLAPFNLRPHWGKLFTIPAAELQPRYEMCAAFKRVVARHDPNGKFRNEFLTANLYR